MVPKFRDSTSDIFGLLSVLRLGERLQSAGDASQAAGLVGSGGDFRQGHIQSLETGASELVEKCYSGAISLVQFGERRGARCDRVSSRYQRRKIERYMLSKRVHKKMRGALKGWW